MTESITQKGTGMTAGIIACVLAVLGIFTIGFVFVPLAFITTCIGGYIAVKNKNSGGIGVCVLGLILTIVGLFTSPILLAFIGLA